MDNFKTVDPPSLCNLTLKRRSGSMSQSNYMFWKRQDWKKLVGNLEWKIQQFILIPSSWCRR